MQAGGGAEEEDLKQTPTERGARHGAPSQDPEI